MFGSFLACHLTDHEQSARIKSLNDELTHRHQTCEDLRKRLGAQAEALKKGAQTAASLEEKIEKENEELFEARRLRSIAEEQEARAFEIELRSTATKQKETYGKDMETLHKESEHIKEQLQLAKENNDILEGQLRSSEEKVITLTRELEKWKVEEQARRIVIIAERLDEHGERSPTGLETALAQKESIINRQSEELHDLKLNNRNLQSEVESLTESLNSALHREENLRKHTEQGKLSSAQQEQTELSKSSKTLQEQRDKEIVASSEMFKKLEEKAVKEVEYKTRIQQVLDLNAKLQKEKDKFEEQMIASNLQAISNKSRWAFASYQNDILVKKLAELKSESEALKSKLRGAMDALDRAHHGVLLTEGKKFMENLNKYDEPQDGKQVETLQQELNNAAKEIEFKNKKIVEYARALEQLRSEMKEENSRRSVRKEEPGTPTLRHDAAELVNSLRNRVSELEHENQLLLDKLQYAREDAQREFTEERDRLTAQVATVQEIADQRLKRLRERDQIYARLSEKSSRSGSNGGTGFELYDDGPVGRGSLLGGDLRSPARARQGSLLRSDGLVSSSDSATSSERPRGDMSESSRSQQSIEQRQEPRYRQNSTRNVEAAQVVTTLLRLIADEEAKVWEDEPQASELSSSVSLLEKEERMFRASHGSSHKSTQELTLDQFLVGASRELEMASYASAGAAAAQGRIYLKSTIACPLNVSKTAFEGSSKVLSRASPPPFAFFFVVSSPEHLIADKDMLSGTYNFDREIANRREAPQVDL
ncbi:hypothetical protein GUITHDRAFT_121006 [Guillardia theta CCMP2712]|uniref:Uncharacterized protein n=1 Tax=Guillardia theta (strain CCMP2712) TaxID=905079 RepID=L1IAG4_GUITC|nr:hypothetical protein GUITHDRAFT_121006 [Guillardia theta CCMP2712]EKX32810.1 hypothetical protein GUITHDRAFT_121006 [Guillardia theta CCMP2712]|eukprot:XP_005819790.1 hypothetical protein GUITHDRAFT_121006 [Guillardia theta CCMP2712]